MSRGQVARLATTAIAAEARFLAFCDGPEEKRIKAALSAHRRAMMLLAAVPAVTFADLQQKGLALETAVIGRRIECDFGLAVSLLRDLRNVRLDA